jgi:hypothetical protein
MPQPPTPGEAPKPPAPNLNMPKGMNIPKPPKIDALNSVAISYTQTRNGPTIFPKNIGLHDTGNDLIGDVGHATRDVADKGVNKVTDLLAGKPKLPTPPIKPPANAHPSLHQQYKTDLANHTQQTQKIMNDWHAKRSRINNRLNTVVKPVVNNIKTVPVGEGDGNALFRSLEKAPQNLKKLWNGEK